MPLTDFYPLPTDQFSHLSNTHTHTVTIDEVFWCRTCMHVICSYSTVNIYSRLFHFDNDLNWNYQIFIEFCFYSCYRYEYVRNGRKLLISENVITLNAQTNDDRIHQEITPPVFISSCVFLLLSSVSPYKLFFACISDWHLAAPAISAVYAVFFSFFLLFTSAAWRGNQ